MTTVQIAAFVSATLIAAPCAADPARDRLLAAYPDALERIEGNDLVWRDGTRMAIDDGRAAKSHADKLAMPDLKDMLEPSYPAGAPALAPAIDFDPGRARNAAFFNKLYGDCRQDGVRANLVEVAWLPSRNRQPVLFNMRHGASAHLAAVSARLDVLPAAFTVYLLPLAGSYNCRAIAGSDQRSAHGYGIAIDLALTHAHYWRWSKPKEGDHLGYQNLIPPEIIAAFEAEGFIWGGRWSHYDTMHFEYRPELFPTLAR